MRTSFRQSSTWSARNAGEEWRYSNVMGDAAETGLQNGSGQIRPPEDPNLGAATLAGRCGELPAFPTSLHRSGSGFAARGVGFLIGDSFSLPTSAPRFDPLKTRERGRLLLSLPNALKKPGVSRRHKTTSSVGPIPTPAPRSGLSAAGPPRIAKKPREIVVVD